MSRERRPFFRKPRGLWYVQLNGRQINLGPEREAAFVEYHRLMAEVPGGPAPNDSVRSVLEKFLAWCQTHRPDSYVWYRQRLRQFALHLPADTGVADLKPHHVQEWADSNKAWKPGHKRGSIVAVQRAFRWAEKMGHIDRSPVRGVEKPEAGRREQVVTEGEYRLLRDRYADREFKDLLDFSWHAGARPQETVLIEAAHYDRQKKRVVLPKELAKGKRRIRVIYLNDEAGAIVERLAARHAAGKVFRNTDGSPWTSCAINCRFGRLRVFMGSKLLRERGYAPDDEEVAKELASVKPTRKERGREVAKTQRQLLGEARKKVRSRHARKLGERFCLYVFRHTFGTRLLEAGVDPLTVSVLLGHVDTTMLCRVYGHVSQNDNHLHAALGKLKGPGA